MTTPRSPLSPLLAASLQLADLTYQDAAPTKPVEPGPRRLNLNPEKPEIPCSRCNGTCIRDDIRFTGRDRGRYVYLVTCIGCRTVQRIESDRPIACRAEAPSGHARNAPCPCGSGRKAKRCHPAGVG